MSVINDSYEVVAVDKLIEHPRNVRRGDLASNENSIRHNGFYGTLVVQRTSSFVLAGNHRLRAAKAVGLSAVPVIWVDVDPATELRILTADNRTSDLATNDTEALLALLTEMRSDDNLSGTGYDDDDLDAMLESLGAAPEMLTDPDDVPEPPKEPVTKLGDLWLLGPHRLMCGSSVDPVDVARLLGGGTPTLLVTDPPYGVSLDMEWRDRAGHNSMAPASESYMKQPMAGKGTSGDTVADWSAAFELVSSLEVAYVWHATSGLVSVAQGLERVGFELRQQIIWAKTVAAMSRSAYHWKHEPCWYGVKKGCTASWLGGHDQTTLWEAASPKHIMSGSKEEKFDHPTQKPFELMARSIRNHSGNVYEPFGGSGTTLIAAHDCGRTNWTMELEPRFADVICRRYQKFTGDKPILESTGEPHDFCGDAR